MASLVLFLLLSFSHSLLLLLLLHGAPMEHLVIDLPGQPLVTFQQFSGYMQADKNTNTNLFYYFVEAESNSSSLPLVLWLNGGPGCSSIGGGAFTELGPFFPSSNGKGLRRNPNSWNKVANLLFLESPAGVGWSYSEGKNRDYYDYDDWKVARESMSFMKKWFQSFPEYKRNQLFLTGESYAGHYIPQLAWLMVSSQEFNLKGVMIGNPLLDYGIDTSATYSFLWSHGIISDDTFHGVSRWCDFRYGYMGGDRKQKEMIMTMESNDNMNNELMTKQRKKKGGGCTSFLGSARAEMGRYINIYDVTSDVCLPPIHRQAFLLHKLMGLAGDKEEIDVCIDHEITQYLNQPSVQHALHANISSLPYPWEACSRIVDYNATDELTDVVPLLVRLLENHLPVWIFSGDQDSVVPLTGTRSQITKLARRMKLISSGPYRPWYAQGQVGGWYEAFGDDMLVYATVRGASHMVPYTQPERALVLFTSFISRRPFASRI